MPVFFGDDLKLATAAPRGRWLTKRIHNTLFANLIYPITFGMGLYLLMQGVGGLVRH